MLKKTDAMRAIYAEGNRWELPTHGFKCGVPWANHPGQLTDATSGLHLYFHAMVDAAVITEDERLDMLHGGEFQP